MSICGVCYSWCHEYGSFRVHTTLSIYPTVNTGSWGNHIYAAICMLDDTSVFFQETPKLYVGLGYLGFYPWTFVFKLRSLYIYPWSTHWLTDWLTHSSVLNMPLGTCQRWEKTYSLCKPGENLIVDEKKDSHKISSTLSEAKLEQCCYSFICHPQVKLKIILFNKSILATSGFNFAKRNLGPVSSFQAFSRIPGLFLNC